jgi:hypothetical protein
MPGKFHDHSMSMDKILDINLLGKRVCWNPVQEAFDVVKYCQMSGI